jgi:hypothetical protein
MRISLVLKTYFVKKELQISRTVFSLRMCNIGHEPNILVINELMQCETKTKTDLKTIRLQPAEHH